MLSDNTFYIICIIVYYEWFNFLVVTLITTNHELTMQGRKRNKLTELYHTHTHLQKYILHTHTQLCYNSNTLSGYRKTLTGQYMPNFIRNNTKPCFCKIKNQVPLLVLNDV